MIGIDISRNGNLLQCSCYKLKNGKKVCVPFNKPIHELIEVLEDEEITNIKLLNQDIMFDTDNAKIIIRDYTYTNKLNGMQILRSKINQYYRIQQLRKRKVKRQNAFKRAVVISGVLAIGFVGVKTISNINKNDVVIPNDDIVVESQADDEIIQNVPIIFEEPEVIADDTPKVNIDFDNRTTSPKYIKTKELYGDIITKYANRYGVDPNLMLAVATHERGVHSNTIDKGGGLGLMQVQRGVWNNYNLKVFNYETQSYETIQIRDNNLADLEGNIQIGCAIMQDNLNRLNNNPLMALQAYNYGVNYVDTCVNAYAKDNNLSYKEIVSDYTNTDWMKYRNIINGGDSNYIENVLSYIGDEFKIENMSRNGSVSLRILNEIVARTHS